jgi:hypothetical protein
VPITRKTTMKVSCSFLLAVPTVEVFFHRETPCRNAKQSYIISVFNEDHH